MRETFDDSQAYDLIIMSVNHNQLEEAAKLIGPHIGNATILIFNNIWKDSKKYDVKLPRLELLKPILGLS